jgi:hypothetical protein
MGNEAALQTASFIKYKLISGLSGKKRILSVDYLSYLVLGLL